MVRTSGQNVHTFPVMCAWLAEAPSVHFNRGFIFTLPPEIIPTLQSEQGRAVLKDILRTCMEITVDQSFHPAFERFGICWLSLKGSITGYKVTLQSLNWPKWKMWVVTGTNW